MTSVQGLYTIGTARRLENGTSTDRASKQFGLGYRAHTSEPRIAGRRSH